MKNLVISIIFSAGAGGCAAWGGAPVTPGEPAGAVRAALGRPTAEYQLGADTVLEYAKGPSGQVTYMARIGADQRLLSYEQVLTSERFATIRPGIDTKATVLPAFGRPAEVTQLRNPPLEVWAYRYKEREVWDSMMYVHFDPRGVVRKVVNGPDPEREERWR